MALISIVSCGSTKNRAETEATGENADTKTETKMSDTNENANFKKGLIVMNEDKSLKCDFYIQDLASKEILDPINLKDEFKVADKKVWFNFSRLRMKNRCGNHLPVSITEIKTRLSEK